MADASPKTSYLQQPHASRHYVHDEGSDDDDSADGSISQADSLEGEGRLSYRLEQRRATCRYFDNHPQTIRNKRVLGGWALAVRRIQQSCLITCP
jgi:predicted nicotinamide N-methyase